MIDDPKEEFKPPKAPKITNFQKAEGVVKSFTQYDPIKLPEMGADNRQNRFIQC